MIVKEKLILANNPFFNSYYNTDILGKLIFVSLLFISVVSWIIIIQKVWETWQIREQAKKFKKKFEMERHQPLKIECASTRNPFMALHAILKRYTLDVLKKNRLSGNDTSYLTPPDIDFVDSHLQMTIATQVKKLENNLFILATIIPLAPFLGLLGTVWGILNTFSEMQTHAIGTSQQAVLGGLSLALTTTVLGLIDAIPALIGYNYLKNTIRDFQTDMEGFSTDILAAVEMQYRKVDVQ